MANTRTGGNAGNASSPEDLLRLLQNKITALEEQLSSQQEKITQMESAPSNGASSSRDMSRVFKASDIPAFSGKKEERNSQTLRAFFYSIRKVGKVCGFSEEKLLEIAELRLHGKAASWMERLEEQDGKPTTLEEFRKAIFKEFVPANEQNKAKLQLMNLKMKMTLEEHISYFQDLVLMSQTPASEMYHYFFMSLPNSYKEQFTKKFPSQTPDCIQDAYEFARTISLAATWRQDKTNAEKEKHNEGSIARFSGSAKKTEKKTKDDTLETWGPCRSSGERQLYFNTDRCTKCGKKGWSDPDHPCRKHKAFKKDPKA